MPGLVFQRSPASLKSVKLTPASFHRLLLLDIHGTVTSMPELTDITKDPSLVELYPGVKDLLSFYKSAGWFIAGISNESGIAKATVRHEDVQRIMAKLQELSDSAFDAFVYCPHDAKAAKPELSQCMCRIPSYGLIIQARFMLTHIYQVEFPAHKILLVSDTAAGQECAAAASIAFRKAADWRNEMLSLNSSTLIKPWMRS